MKPVREQFDVVIVGKGNAALCAALAARDEGASVAMWRTRLVETSPAPPFWPFPSSGVMSTATT